MVPIHLSTETWRKNFRSVVLLALLGVCSAVAWVLAWHKSAPAREAQGILAAIRRNGIKSYWPENVQRRQWFLIRRDGQIVGWEMEYRQAGPGNAGGGFERQTNGQKKQIRISSRWRLSNDSEHGEYESQRLEYLLPQSKISQAKIVLQNRTLQVFQNIDGARYISTAAAPENYLPEGLMLLAIQEVARRKTRARFEMVLDESPPGKSQGGQTPLFSFELRYIGVDAGIGGAMVETSYGHGNSLMTVIDDNGDILRVYGEHVESTPASRETILEYFPAAVEFISDEETVEL